MDESTPERDRWGLFAFIASFCDRITSKTFRGYDHNDALMKVTMISD
jgi:hypothetical protein